MINFHNNPSTNLLTAFKRISADPFEAHASFELRMAHSNETISYNQFIDRLQYSQRIVKERFDLNLSAQVSKCDVVLHKQHESQLRLDFINYPEFPTEIPKLKAAIIFLTEFLAQQLSQNRVVITFPDEHIMLTQNSQRDPDTLTPKELPQELQAQALFEKYQGPILLSSWLNQKQFLSKRFPELIKHVSPADYQNPQEGIPLFLRAIQGGKAHPVHPKLDLYYEKPTQIAIYTKFLLSGTSISLEIWEVEGKVDLNASEPGKLINKYVCQS